MMNLEIEHKFMVADGWRVSERAAGEPLRQGYLNQPGAPFEVRVRAGGGRS